jgi:trans-aconitate methyltransferase
VTRSDTEIQRLNTVHWGMRELWETSVRVPVPHQAPRILDVGCGSGIWAKEVAEVLPRAQIVGVDLSPTFLLDEPGRPIPANLSFEVILPPQILFVIP